MNAGEKSLMKDSTKIIIDQWYTPVVLVIKFDAMIFNDIYEIRFLIIIDTNSAGSNKF